MSEQTKTDYKNTLNLPQTTLEMRANATVKELQTQKFWEEKNIYEKRCVENCGLRRMVTSLRRLSYVLICMVQEALACLNIFILAFHFMTFQFFTCFTSAVWYYLPSVFFVIFVPILKMTLFIQLLEIRIERRFI